MKILLLVVVCALLCSCEPSGPQPPETQLVVAKPPVELGHNDGRFSVEILNTFRDDLAYGRERGIYLIRDQKTGQEYVGVSGIGISELGSHKEGKHTYTDER